MRFDFYKHQRYKVIKISFSSIRIKVACEYQQCPMHFDSQGHTARVKSTKSWCLSDSRIEYKFHTIFG